MWGSSTSLWLPEAKLGKLLGHKNTKSLSVFKTPVSFRRGLVKVEVSEILFPSSAEAVFIDNVAWQKVFKLDGSLSEAPRLFWIFLSSSFSELY